jgi:flagellar hook assembly protein FlgD
LGGTPGQQNSADQIPVTNDVIVLDLSSDPFTEQLRIACRLPFVPALLSVAVYDAEGNFVIRLRDWEQAALEATVEWDGRKKDGQPSSPGLYVLSARASADGRIVHGKAAVVRQ